MNITCEKARVLKEIKNDRSQVLFTADKRLAMVVLEKQDYISKAQELLGQSDTYRALVVRPKKHKKLLTYLVALMQKE